MRVLPGVVLCILIESEFFACFSSAQSQTTDIAVDTTEAPVSFFPTQEDGNCTYVDPPVNETTTPENTSVRLIYTTRQANPNCLPSILVVECLALLEENQNGWQWVRNSSANSTVDNANNRTVLIVEGLTHFTNYTCYASLTLENDSLSSPPNQVKFQTEAAVSGPPVNLTIREISSRNFTVQWEPPEKNPGVLKQYYVHVTSQGPNHFRPPYCPSHLYDEWNVTEEGQYIVLDVFPDYNYSITVFLENSAGNGNEARTTIRTETAASEVPTDFALGEDLDVEANEINLTVTWNAPCTPNGPIQLFQIYLEGYYLLNSSYQDIRWFQVPTISNQTSYVTVIEHLMPASDYEISLQANGATENGNLYNYSCTTEDNWPGPPLLENVTGITPTSFGVSWTAPERRSGTITNYTVTIISLGPMYDTDLSRCAPSQKPVSVILPGDKLAYNFTDGRPYYSYNILVFANTSKGSGESSQLKAGTTSSAPEKVGNLTLLLLHENATDALVSWIAPCNWNGPVKNFFVSIQGNYSEDGSLPVSKNVSIPYKEFVYVYKYNASLLESYHYEIAVWAGLEDGTEGQEEVSNLTIPDGYPGPPIITGIHDIGNTSFSISWNRPTKKNGRIIQYRVTVTSLGPQYESNCSVNNQSYSTTIAGNVTNFSFNRAEAYYNYSVFMEATTSRGFGVASGSLFVMTEPAVPENVRNVAVRILPPTKVEYNAHTNVTFEHPCKINGPSVSYELQLNGTRGSKTIMLRYNTSQLTSFTKIPLEPEFSYQMVIRTSNGYYENATTFPTFLAPSGIPQFSKPVTEMHVQVETSSAQVVLHKTDFDTTNGDVRYIAVIISERNETGGYFNRWLDWPRVNNSKGLYQITPDWWNPFENADNVTLTIGNETSCNESANHCNKALETGQDYYLIIRVFTNDFYRNSPAIYFRTDELSKLGVILGVIFGLLGFAVLGISGFFVWRKYKQKISPILYTRKASSVKEPSNGKTSVAIHKFVQYCKGLDNSPEKYSRQYLLLYDKSKELTNTFTTEFALLTENRRKNRYSNILPFDETRVKLLIDEDDEIGSDYINASYIRGYSGNVEYIATQGPLSTTCRDFWKMVIQENVTVIVMVTQFIENNKEKCYKYIPDNHQTMKVSDDIEVSCVTELHFGTYCVRTIQIKKDATQVTVTHMQYLDWPDFNVPQDTGTMLQFCHQMRERVKRDRGYIIVHCSAGVGRTGTLIATDILVQDIKAGKDIDIFNTVLELRTQRRFMVQAEKQYVYIHHLIRDTIEQSQAIGMDNLGLLYEHQSTVQLKTDGDSLINKDEEKESQF